MARIEGLCERHRITLRAAAEEDPAIHRYTNLYTFGFDQWFDLALSTSTEVPFAIVVDGKAVGSTRYHYVEPIHRRVEIGWTWLNRDHWGTGINTEVKYLLLRNAFENWGAMRVEFKTDARNRTVWNCDSGALPGPRSSNGKDELERGQ